MLIAEDKKAEPKKRQSKSGFKRLTINLQESEYEILVKEAKDQMREPNNLLSYILKGKINDLLVGS